MLKISKYILAFSLIFIFFQDAVAQRKIKYKDVYDMILTGNQEKSYSLLLEYQRQDPEFPNTYFQLGIISYEWAKSYDPFNDLEMVELFIYNTKLFFGLAKAKLLADDKDVKKNKDYFMNVDILKQIDKIEYEDAVKFIDTKIEEIKKHDVNIHEIINNFDSSVMFYNQCLDIFMDININNTKIKEMYLYPSDDLSLKIQNIITDFDSSLYFFEKYKNALNNYPIGNYNQTTVIKPIETFRLDGLTNSNFLNDSIIIWDYKTWAKDLKSILEADVSELRKEINSVNKEISDKETNLKKTNLYSDDYEAYGLDNKLIFKIEKFDYKSIVSSLFTYRSSKIDFIVHSKKVFNNPLDTLQKNNITKRAKLYYQSVNKYETSDSLLEVFYESITAKNIKKFETFFNLNYKGITGLQNYYKTEKSDLETTLNSGFNNLKISYFNENVSFISDSVNFEYQKNKIPFYTQNPDFTKGFLKQYYTTFSKFNGEANYFIGGYNFLANSAQSFIAKTDGKSQIIWLKTIYNTSNSYDFVSNIEANGNSCFFTLTSKITDKYKNILYKFNETGVQVSKIELTETKIPRYLKYDDINESLIIAYKGLDFNKFVDFSDTLVIEKINILTQKSEWKTKINLKGDLFEILKIDTIYYVFCNFNSYKNQNNVIITSKAGSSVTNKNIVLIKIYENGEIEGFYPDFSEKSFFGIKAIKIDNEIINILAIEGEQKEISDKQILNSSELIYILIDKFNQKIFSNWQD